MFHERRGWFVGWQLSNETSQLVPEQAVVRHDAELMFAWHRLVPEIASGAFENQSAGGDVPEANSCLDVGIHPAAGHVGHRQRGGAHNANFADAMHQSI